MTVIITGAVTIGGRQYPVQCQVQLPETSDRSGNHLRIVPRAS